MGTSRESGRWAPLSISSIHGRGERDEAPWALLFPPDTAGRAGKARPSARGSPFQGRSLPPRLLGSRGRRPPERPRERSPAEAGDPPLTLRPRGSTEVGGGQAFAAEAANGRPSHADPFPVLFGEEAPARALGEARGRWNPSKARAGAPPGRAAANRRRDFAPGIRGMSALSSGRSPNSPLPSKERSTPATPRTSMHSGDKTDAPATLHDGSSSPGFFPGTRGRPGEGTKSRRRPWAAKSIQG